MAWLNASMRLSGDTKKITTKSGKPMTVGHGYIDVGAESGYGIGIVAFGEIATELAKYKKGSTVAVTGKLQLNAYTNKEGTEISQLQCVLDGLSGIKKRSPVHQEYSGPKKQTFGSDEKKATDNLHGFNDEIGF